MKTSNLFRLRHIFFLSLVFLLLIANPISLVFGDEDENVDSFIVHPLNRWDTYTVNGMTDTIDYGMLKITDTGDASSDSVDMRRSLRSSEGKIIVKFYMDADKNATMYHSRYLVSFHGVTGGKNIGFFRKSELYL